MCDGDRSTLPISFRRRRWRTEPPIGLLTAAGKHRPGLSCYDHFCLIAAKEAGWTCVTNDGRLRRECSVDNVRVLWGLEPMLDLVGGGHMTASRAREVAERIHQANPLFIAMEMPWCSQGVWFRALRFQLKAAPLRTSSISTSPSMPVQGFRSVVRLHFDRFWLWRELMAKTTVAVRFVRHVLTRRTRGIVDEANAGS